MKKTIAVTVAYANQHEQWLEGVEVAADTTLEQALRESGVLAAFPEIDLDKNQVGIWAQKKPLDTVLKNGDRIEIYRPLLLSPTEARKLRAQRMKS